MDIFLGYASGETAHFVFLMMDIREISYDEAVEWLPAPLNALQRTGRMDYFGLYVAGVLQSVMILRVVSNLSAEVKTGLGVGYHDSAYICRFFANEAIDQEELIEFITNGLLRKGYRFVLAYPRALDTQVGNILYNTLIESNMFSLTGSERRPTYIAGVNDSGLYSLESNLIAIRESNPKSIPNFTMSYKSLFGDYLHNRDKHLFWMENGERFCHCAYTGIWTSWSEASVEHPISRSLGGREMAGANMVMVSFRGNSLAGAKIWSEKRDLLLRSFRRSTTSLLSATIQNVIARGDAEWSRMRGR